VTSWQAPRDDHFVCLVDHPRGYIYRVPRSLCVSSWSASARHLTPSASATGAARTCCARGCAVLSLTPLEESTPHGSARRSVAREQCVRGLIGRLSFIMLPKRGRRRVQCSELGRSVYDNRAHTHVAPPSTTPQTSSPPSLSAACRGAASWASFTIYLPPWACRRGRSSRRGASLSRGSWKAAV
jgi:hypothetical protein